MTNFWVKSTLIVSVLASKNLIIYNLIFVATKNGRTKTNFSSSSFGGVVGSGIRDPGSGMDKNQDPG
jgi:hypothetical protein